MIESILVIGVILYVVCQVVGQCDSLTGLPNRTRLVKQLNKLVYKARRKDAGIAVVMLDLDHFERINEARGSLFGDELLRKISYTLQRYVKEAGTVSRIRADRFGIIFEDVASKNELARLVERIYGLFSKGFFVKGIPVKVTFSAGTALYPYNGDNSIELLKNADTALLQAKETGRNHALHYSQEMNQAVKRRAMLEEHIDGALQRNEFVLSFQPQFALPGGDIRGFAASIRWEHPEAGTVLADELLLIAADAGLMWEIEEWMLKEACEKNREIQKLHLPHSVIAIPISLKSLKQPAFWEEVKRVLRATGMTPDSLVLEVREHELCTGGDVHNELGEELRAIGVTLCLADFGKGYASLHSLKQLPIHRLKIDPLFIGEIGADKTGNTIIQSLITLGHKLGLPVTAAGVETYEQLHYLRALGCDYMQGSLVSKPLPYEELPHLFAILRYKPHALKSEART
ncbi:bifunctional diguanylate cyclase/phosphodiesterase [Brevibacillus fluminis]|uniref:Bifunctional diguanylate cyclase/phosphodiesterase n=1 Tax=Brevibacillus fluminis TaxID=511487 RepID=A0A3M8DP96_9BACL|nr:bifunctional diguanylate cyclase/phosphodiesterase [Brevibacillus fluminis]RNB89942.1 bifunctional diguanylate cyclase/phosphodiesterase [Brevibacillus fluminis]